MKVTALAGGVGAAKLLVGLSEALPPEDISIIVNTGDDFRWFGLYVCPDLDTVTYTLGGLANPMTGWGIRDDTFHSISQMKRLGLDAWFRVGDRDLALHILRTRAMAEGQSLGEITDRVRGTLGIGSDILPMTEQPVPTLVHTAEGTLPFQDYFVRRKCQPPVKGFTFSGLDEARPAPRVLQAISGADAVIVCPSNPFISIGPILGVPGIRNALSTTRAKVLAVSPLIAGRALKGPTAKMLSELGHEVSATSVALMYRDFLDIFVMDRRDEGLAERIASTGPAVRLEETRMDAHEDKVHLARRILEML